MKIIIDFNRLLLPDMVLNFHRTCQTDALITSKHQPMSKLHSFDKNLNQNKTK